MCTIINDDPTGKEAIGWKVVSKNRNKISSFYEFQFRWTPDSLHTANSLYTDNEVVELCDKDSKVFHCFARREDARKFKRNNKENRKKAGYMYYRGESMQIIKLKLSGAVFEGITDGMSRPDCDGLPAICATKAYWDGKFHR